MNVLVTGGAGFIGSHLVDALIARGDQVSVVDNLSSGRAENVNRAAQLHAFDICDADVDRVLGDTRPEVVFHLAAQISVSASTRDPEADIRDNIVGTVRLAETCIRHGVGMLVFASSAAVYGEPEVLPVSEDAPARPMSPYAVDKYAGELYLRYFAERQGLGIRILRFANVYGPRQPPHGEAGVVAIFTAAILRGEPVRIFGDGLQSRDFIYVDDVVKACLLAPKACSEGPVNIGTGLLTNVYQLHYDLAVGCEQARNAEYAEPRPGDIYAICLDPTRARECLGWSAETDWATGLRATIQAARLEAE